MAKKKLLNVIDVALWGKIKAVSILRKRKIEDIVEEALREYITHHAKQLNSLLGIKWESDESAISKEGDKSGRKT